jgi:hypothetical protein
MTRVLCAIAVFMLSLPMLALAAEPECLHVFEAAGATPADIQGTVDDFRGFLGEPNNQANPPNPLGGRREINWDAVPDAFADPNDLPANFFNVNSPRGAVFDTPGTAFRVSANENNPTNTPVRFGSIHNQLPQLFSTFSPQRLFTAIDSNITDVHFFVPGSTTAATVNGFGAVFTDVNSGNSTRIDYFDVNGELLCSRNVLPGPTNRGSLSFLGVGFDTPEVFQVRITSGNRVLRNPDRDTVVMDDFIYGEPQALP